MRLRVKICGIASGADLEAVAALRPDAVGFVFWSGSPRAASASEVGAWTRGLDRAIAKVGVFVDAPAAEVRRAAAAAGLDVVQWHGEGAPPDELRGLRVWRVARPGGADAGAASAGQEAWVLDSGTRERPGGTGVPCDWDAAAAFVRAAALPVWLAGGLGPSNVAGAVRRVRPFGVDVSSGVESAPGAKDIGKVREFIATCRSFDR